MNSLFVVSSIGLDIYQKNMFKFVLILGIRLGAIE